MTAPSLTLVPVKSLQESPTNPRKSFDKAKLKELADSIEQNGMLQPITVRPIEGGRFEVVFGHRRFKAACLAKMKEVPCQVRELTDRQVADMQLVENCQREDVHPVEESDSIESLIRQGFYDSPQAVADKIGRPVDYVLRRLALQKLGKQWRKILLGGEVAIGMAELAATLDDQQQNALFAAVKDPYGPKTVREVRTWIRKQNTPLDEAPFDLDDATLHPKAGPCTDCPFNRASRSRILFGDEEPICEKRACFDQKVESWLADRLREAEEDNPGEGFILIGTQKGTFAGREVEERWGFNIFPEPVEGSVRAFYAITPSKEDLGKVVWVKRWNSSTSRSSGGGGGVTSERKAEIRAIKVENLFRQKLYDWVCEYFDPELLSSSPFLWPILVHLRRTFQSVPLGNAKLHGPAKDDRGWIDEVGPGIGSVSEWDKSKVFRTLLDYAAAHEVPYHDYHKPEPVLLMEFAEHLSAPVEELRKAAEYELMSKKEKKALEAGQ